LPRRVSLPAADELFRPTGPDQDGPLADERGIDGAPASASQASPGSPSGRVRHDEKMTVYVTADELLDLEQARLTLRRLGMGVDRGRLVRAAIAMALADLHDHGEDSAVVHRLKQA
jgi:hypothetical protein